jgi:hypothetical protein
MSKGGIDMSKGGGIDMSKGGIDMSKGGLDFSGHTSAPKAHPLPSPKKPVTNHGKTPVQHGGTSFLRHGHAVATSTFVAPADPTDAPVSNDNGPTVSLDSPVSTTHGQLDDAPAPTPTPYAQPKAVPYGPVWQPPSAPTSSDPPSVFAGHTREFDYHTFSLGIGIPGTSFGISVQDTVDSYGQEYTGGGLGWGKSPSWMPVSLSYMGGTLDQTKPPSKDDLASFIAGKSGNFTAGAGLGFGTTYSYSPNSGVAHTATEVGFTTPTIGGGACNTTQIIPGTPPAPVPEPTPTPSAK